MFGPKLDARSYTTFLLMVIAVLLSISLFAQQTPATRPNVATVGEVSAAGSSIASATSEVAAATREVAAANREIATALRLVATAISAAKEAAPAAAATVAAPAETDGPVTEAEGTANYSGDPNAEPVVTTSTNPSEGTININ